MLVVNRVELVADDQVRRPLCGLETGLVAIKTQNGIVAHPPEQLHMLLGQCRKAGQVDEAEGCPNDLG